MTPDEARRLLDDVRAGVSLAPPSRIRLALQMTGDLPGWRESAIPQEPALRLTKPAQPMEASA
jgi:hypothetical protein